MIAGHPFRRAIRRLAARRLRPRRCCGRRVAAVALTFPALTGRIVDQANVISADARRAIEPKLADLETKSGIQLVVATVNSLEGQEIEPYANALFRGLEARREDQEQRRAAARRAEGAAGSHRGRLWPRRHADRCAGQGHHHQRDHAPLQGRRLQRRHFARRRRHHHGPHHRCIRVGEAPRVAAGQSASQRSGQLGHHSDCHRRHRAAHRVARIPLVLLQRRAEYPAEFGRLARSSGGSFGGGGGGFSGGGGSSGGGGASGSW